MLKEKIKGFIAGVCATVLLAGAVTVFAANIDVVMGGIKIYWDGIEKTLTDANGNKVEPMIYEGTTYVPLRAMANLMGKEVDWDQQNMAVIVGEKPVAESTSIDDMKDNINNEYDIYFPTNKTFKLKNVVVNCDNLMYASDKSYGCSGYITYMLDGKYSELTGKVVYPYETVGSSSEGHITFYSIDNSGNEKEIETYKFKQTDEPIDVKINLKGVENLKIDLSGGDKYHRTSPAFYDVYFLGE